MSPPRPEAPEARSPAVSVVICSYTLERLELLTEAIASVRSQSHPAHEIVLVVDNSSELLATAQRLWPEIETIPNRDARGLSGSRNTGVAATSGDVVAFLDDDAVAGPEWIGRLAAEYADPGVMGVGGPIRPRWETGRPPWFPPEFDWIVGCTHSGMPKQPARVRNLVGANMSFRRLALERAGGFRHEMSRIGKYPTGGEETDLCIRVQEHWPASILFEPGVRVDHFVPAARATTGYFRTRCIAEGRSKAVLSHLVGGGSGLESERTYVRRTLPLGALRGIGSALRGDWSGARRAGFILFGLAATTAGYITGRGLLVRDRPSRGDLDRDRLRILMVTPRSPLGAGGVERHVMEVGSRLAAAGQVVEVLCGTPDGPGGIEERDGVAVRSVRAWPEGRDYYIAPAIWPEMARRPWDVVHVQSYHTAVAPLAMLRALVLGIPYVVTFHGGGHSSGLRNRLRRAQRRALRPLLARAARLVAVARFEIDRYSEELGLPRERFVWIPNGTDLVPDAGGAGNGKPTPDLLATIGRLERYKGHHRAIEALPHVIARRPRARLLVVGTGPYEPELRRLAKEVGVADRVEFTSVPPGDPTAMAQLMGRVSLVVLLSEFETHPLVALEAASADRPLLVADAGGLAELAADGVARSVGAGAEPGAVAAAIVEELEHPSERRPPRLTTWDECAARLHDLYRSVV